MKIFFILIISIFIAGCSGRVQTNPLPDDQTMHLPNYTSEVETEIEKDRLDKFDSHIKKELQFFQMQDEKKDIWQIGKDIEEGRL